jgi:acylaminoacyl-peptidase
MDWNLSVVEGVLSFIFIFLIFPSAESIQGIQPFHSFPTSSMASSNLSETISASNNDAIAYHQYASMAVDLSSAHVSDSGWFTVTRSVRDIDMDQRRKFLYATDIFTNRHERMNLPPQELSENVILRLPSPSGKVIAIFRQEIKDKSVEATKTTVLEVWDDYGSCLRRRIELPKKQHGEVICDLSGGFGIPSWNSEETVLVYVAERNSPATVSFFEGPKSKEDRPPVVGGQNVFGVGVTEHYGEKYFKQMPLHDLVCVNIVTGRIGKVTNVPGCATNCSGGYTLGQPVFCPKRKRLEMEDGLNTINVEDEMIVYTAWDAGNKRVLSRRFGLVYCQQRPCQLYLSKVTHLLHLLSLEEDLDEDEMYSDDPPAASLTPHFRLSHSPRFAPVSCNSNDQRSKLVFLCSVKGFDTHSGCFSLRMMDSSVFECFINDSVANEDSSDSFSKVIVEEVWDAPTVSPTDAPSEGHVAGLGFPGLFLPQLPNSCFLSPDQLVTTTQWGSCQKVILISLQSPGSIHLIQLEGGHPYSSDEVLCCSSNFAGKKDGNGIIVSTKTPGSPATVHFIPASQLLRDDATLNPNAPIRACSIVLPTYAPFASSKIASVFSHLQDTTEFEIRVIEAPLFSDVECRHDIQSILLLPKKSSGVLPPLIVVPHGGPHSASVTGYLPSYAFLCGHGGYAVLLVNYRGSTGFGQASVASLPKQIGRLDLEDLIAATKSLCDSGLVDSQRIGICGGSHGGFLTAHATGQYPHLFSAAVMRNPVVNLASMVTSTDIPDWCHVEALGESYDWVRYRPPTPAELKIFYGVSPIQFVQNVRAPTLIAIGLKDLRVPSSQGLEWYYSLRCQEQQPVQLLSYENDDHAIDGVASEADLWIHIKQWFDLHLRQFNPS